MDARLPTRAFLVSPGFSGAPVEVIMVGAADCCAVSTDYVLKLLFFADTTVLFFYMLDSMIYFAHTNYYIISMQRCAHRLQSNALLLRLVVAV